MRGSRSDDFEVLGVLGRVAPYDVSDVDVDVPPADTDELVERAATLLLVLPPNQRRSTIEQLLSADDPERARRAVDTLIASAYVVEDAAGRLRRAARA